MVSDAEAAWRARMFDELVRNKRLSPEEALVFIEHQSHYRPWELATARFPTLKNLDRHRR
jgi:hypothetical protein